MNFLASELNRDFFVKNLWCHFYVYKLICSYLIMQSNYYYVFLFFRKLEKFQNFEVFETLSEYPISEPKTPKIFWVSKITVFRQFSMLRTIQSVYIYSIQFAQHIWCEIIRWSEKIYSISHRSHNRHHHLPRCVTYRMHPGQSLLLTSHLPPFPPYKCRGSCP